MTRETEPLEEIVLDLGDRSSAGNFESERLTDEKVDSENATDGKKKEAVTSETPQQSSFIVSQALGKSEIIENHTHNKGEEQNARNIIHSKPEITTADLNSNTNNDSDTDVDTDIDYNQLGLSDHTESGDTIDKQSPSNDTKGQIDDLNSTAQNYKKDSCCVLSTALNTTVDPLSMKEAKEAVIKRRIEEKQSKLSELQQEYNDWIQKLKNPDPNQTIKRHIRLLKDYNDIRDIALGLLGMIADTKGVRVADVMADYGVEIED
ncbi:Swi5-domain-containing protein [Dipodascopsis uninucleata]